jgi:hypothetical protein
LLEQARSVGSRLEPEQLLRNPRRRERFVDDVERRVRAGLDEDRVAVDRRIDGRLDLREVSPAAGVDDDDDGES